MARKEMTPEEQAQKNSAEQQAKPRTAAQMKKAEKDFDADERVVQRSSYGSGEKQVTRHDGYTYFEKK